jgi:uncharacterized protein YfaT (DUF1175 family)
VSPNAHRIEEAEKGAFSQPNLRNVHLLVSREVLFVKRFAVYLTLPSLLAFALASSSACRFNPSHEARAERTQPFVKIRCADSVQDGIPDCVKLRSYDDRENFRRWFTNICELQFYHASDAWKTEQRDCAGLVRFALRESLRTHDRAWFRRMGAVYEPLAPDVRAYDLARSPLGEKLFRTRFGSFKESDSIDGTFSEFADARTLKDFNCAFISRDRRQAQAGDLLFFYQPWVQKFPYHVMIFLGKARQPDEGDMSDAAAIDWVVYHTGASPTDSGTIKKVRLATLDDHPDKRWRPVASNRNFLGFYRLKILQ